jgi:formate dehydrogenase major subunit
MAECHPVGFQWVMEAKKRGATVIHVDPRFTRTSALADLHVPLRAGSDIAFLGGIVNHVLSNELYFRDYVVAYTNAATILRDDVALPEDLHGLFSGYDPDTGTYDTATWQYAGQGEGAGGGAVETQDAAGAHDEAMSSERARAAGHELGDRGAPLETSVVERDETLQDPRCVLQVLKRHFARYTPELVEEVCGVPREQFLQVCDALVRNSGRERTSAFCYAVGWTQHSMGAQYIRTGAILQLLLGNMGRPGGGIMALRGHASIQGSTDIPTLYNLLPGYLPMPKHDVGGLDDYLSALSPDGQKGYWRGARAYVLSLLKAWYGDAATADNDFCFDLLPRISGDHGTYQTVMGMLDGTVEGYFLVGQNPAVGSAHGRMQRLGMAKLKWLVVRDVNLIESATFWKDAPEVATGEIVPQECETEVFFLPAATHVEKAGTFTQTQRLVQWRHKAVEPPGDARPELHFYFHLGRILRERLAGSTEPRDRALLDLTWDYPVEGEHDEPSADDVLREINGYDLATGELLSSFTQMRPDGTTSGGCWIYTGIYADGVNQSARRKTWQEHGGPDLAHEWGWAWPANRRILYNRASADPQGRPWSERKKLVWWDEEAGRWTGDDVPDFPLTTPPSYRPEPGTDGPEGIAGDDPFVMQADGKGWLWAPKGVLDGPLPEHYEPHESPVRNPVHRQQANPTRLVYAREDNPSNPSPPDPRAEVFPYVFTTYRLTEHHTAGGMSRWVPYLSELQPEFFCEVSPALARERGLEHLGWATIVTARTAVEARVLVTDRMVPLRAGGRTVHQVGLPYHWGVGGEAYVSGDAANDLVGISLDPNVLIQECKAATCDIRPGRRPTGPDLLRFVEEYRTRAGITTATGAALVTEDRS